MKNIFVDGYNVINSWPGLNKIKDYSFEMARVELIEIIQEYAVFKGYKIFIVFDGHMVKNGLEKREKLNSVIVVYTKEGETADSFIERYVNFIGRKVEVCVVTSDSLEQQVTFQRGATRMSSIEFYSEVNNVKNKISLKASESVNKKALLQDRIDKRTLKELEKIRRGH